ncbi:MAG: hypothetical protein QMD09_06625, partial [Desulfatibacillaceae bacterium]|nr:hypothetical protein [Desulfatibacillaceae bacterium]
LPDGPHAILCSEIKKIIELDVNGALYKKKGLPEKNIFAGLLQRQGLSFFAGGFGQAQSIEPDYGF